MQHQAWINGVGKAQKRKGKKLFMPARVAITGRMAGPDVGDQLEVLGALAGAADVAEAGAYVPLADRMAQLKACLLYTSGRAGGQHGVREEGGGRRGGAGGGGVVEACGGVVVSRGDKAAVREHMEEEAGAGGRRARCESWRGGRGGGSAARRGGGQWWGAVPHTHGGRGSQPAESRRECAGSRLARRRRRDVLGAVRERQGGV